MNHSFFIVNAVLFALASPGMVAAAALLTERVSVNPATGIQADGPSDSPVMSANGCVVAFVSQAGTLAPVSFGLTKNSPSQVYAFDRCATPHTIELISVTTDGTAAGDHAANQPNISADGRYVAFMSASTNLPSPGSGQNGTSQMVFVRDRLMHATLAPLQAWRPTPQNNGSLSGYADADLRYMSADGMHFAFFFSSPPAVSDNLYVADISGGTTTLQPFCASSDCLVGTSDYLTFSADGQTILVQSTYPFAAGGSIGGAHSVYAIDVASTTATLVSINANGTPANGDVDPLTDIAMSANGNVSIFSSATASNFPGNLTDTLLLKNRTSGDVALLSATSDGVPFRIGYGVALPQLSDDGNRLVFTTSTPIVPHPLIEGDDAIVIDRTLGRVVSACVSSSGSFGYAGCERATISGDGKWAAFRSTATNLVPNDTNDDPDIFVVSLEPILDEAFADGFEK